MMLLQIQYCVDAQGTLQNFKWVFADDSAEEKVFMPWAGRNQANCDVITVADRAQIEKIRVGRSSDQLAITGLFIRLQGVEEPVKLGITSVDFTDFEFALGKELAVGMYGAANTDYITELGFIVIDNACVEAEALNRS